MKLPAGAEYNRASASDVDAFLRRRNLESILAAPDSLSVQSDGRGLSLRVSNGRVREYPVRQAFLDKLMRWFSFPLHKLDRLNIDTVSSISNDLLLSIQAPAVKVTVENGEAVTITSTKYSEFSDLEVLEMCGPFGIESVSRNDFFLRVYTTTRVQTEPVPGDLCGFGFNIINSENGFRPLSVRHFITRYVCSNGAVVRLDKGQSSRSHYGSSTPALRKFLADRLALGDARRQELVRWMSGSTHLSPTDEQRARLGRLLRWSGGVKMDELRRVEIGQAATVYDLFNLATSAAREMRTGPRLRLEEFAGTLIAEGG